MSKVLEMVLEAKEEALKLKEIVKVHDAKNNVWCIQVQYINQNEVLHHMLEDGIESEDEANYYLNFYKQQYYQKQVS